MNNIPYEVKDMHLLPKCWIHENGRKMLNYFHLELPTTRKEYEEVLKKLGIPYRIVTDKYGHEQLAYWNPELYEEEEILLPAYAKMPNGIYRYINDYTGKIPTENTVLSARKMSRKIDDVIGDIELCEYFKDALGTKKAIGIFTMRVIEEKDLISNGIHIKVIPVCTVRNGVKRKTEYRAVFNVNTIELNSIVTIEVPSGKEGLFIGQNHWQVNEWCRKFGLKGINVVGI